MNRKRLVSLVLSVALLAGGVAPSVHAETIESAQQKAKELEEQKKQAEKEKSSLNEQLNTIISDLKEAQKKVEAKEDEIAVAEDELVAAQIKEADQYERMKIRIKYMYENGDSEMIEILLSAEDMGDFLNKAEYVEQISSYDREMLVEFQNLVKDIEEKEAKLKKEKKELESLQNSLADKQSEVQSLLDSKQSEISSLETEIGENAKVLNELIAQAKEAERRRKEAEEAAKKAAAANKGNSGGGSSSGGGTAGPSVVVSGSGYLSNPCPSAYISSEFGPRKAPVAGASTYHQGRDYAAAAGTPIYAAAEGTVIRRGYQAVRGNYVVVRHPNGLTTWYQHCTSIFVSAGQKVSRGQNIATVGATGRVSGPHLHFIVEEASGALVDPRKYL